MITFTSLGGPTIRVDNGKASLLVFPPDAKSAKDGEVVLFSTPDETPSKHVVSWPGEYDIEGVAILGIAHEEGKYVSYALDTVGVRSAYLCSPLHDWTDHDLELLGDVDVLFIPSDDPKLIQKLIDEIDPRVLCIVNTGGNEKHAEALKICGAQNVEPVKEYKVKGSLPAEGREVVVFE